MADLTKEIYKGEANIELGGTLYTGAKGDAINKLAYAQQIYDGELKQYLSVINANNATSNTNFTNHIANTSNPHGVTKAQVGLSNVTNESKATMFTSPDFTGTPTAPTADENTNTTQIATTAFVLNAISSKMAANDAMIFKGTIGTYGTVKELPKEHTVGWTYKAVSPGTYAGKVCEIGDLIICILSGTTDADVDWTVAQTNIDGAVTTAGGTGGRLAAFTTGIGSKSIEVAGTYGSSTKPIYLNNGIPTATTYSFGNASGNAAINNGTRNVDLNADMVDGIQGVNIAYNNTNDTNNTSNQFLSLGTTASNITTAQFIEHLKTLKAFDHYEWSMKCSWSYGNNDTITDSGYGNIQLAGSVIKFYRTKGQEYTVEIITSPTTTNNGVANAVFIYRNHNGTSGSDYKPNWLRLANASELEKKSTYIGNNTGTANNDTTSWYKVASGTSKLSNDEDTTLYVHSVYSLYWAYISIRARGGNSNKEGATYLVKVLWGNIPASNVRLYITDKTAQTSNYELWIKLLGAWSCLNVSVVSETDRMSKEGSNIILYESSVANPTAPTLSNYVEATYLTLSNPTINTLSLKSASASEMTNYPGVYYHKGLDFIPGDTNVGGALGMPSNANPTDVTDKNGQLLRCYWNHGYYTDIFISPNNYSGNQCGLFYRQIVNNVATSWRMLLDSYNYKNVMDVASSTTNGLMAKADYGALLELISRTISLSISGTGARFSGTAGNISTSISKLSSLEVTKLELLNGTTNNPTTVISTFTDKATSKSVSVSPTSTTYYRWRATINNKTYQSSVGTITIVSPIYMGFGDNATSVKVDANKHTTAVTSSKGLTLSRTNSTGKQTSLYLLIPTSITQPSSIKSGGAPVAFIKDTTSVSGYTSYKLGALYNNGTAASVELS